MKKNNSLINIEKNKDTNISINNYIGVIDELSCDNIRRNYTNVADIENEFSERIEYSQEVLTKKLLPKQLQDDFDIVPKYVNGKLNFYTKAKTEDAYKKHPIRMNYTMHFDSVEEANQFKNNGIEELQRIADITQQPVEIPNITNMKEFLGEYINPVAPANKYGSEGIKLYICPKPIPPAQKYSIDIFNEHTNFKISTFLRVSDVKENFIELSNKESEKELYNVSIKLSNFKNEEDSELLQGQFNISISIRDEYLDNCEINKEMIKFRFLIEDSNCNILINNEELDVNVFTLSNCGKIKYTKKDYKKFSNLMGIIDKVLYISKIKKINIKYDIDEIIEKEEIINVIYNQLNKRNYKCRKSLTSTILVDDNYDLNSFFENNGKIAYKSELNKVTLFGVEFTLDNYEMIMYDCIVEKLEYKGKGKKLAIKSTNIVFKYNKKD